MRKTNIRAKNYFIIEDEKEYYSSSVFDLKKWIKIDEDELDEYKDENITGQLTSMMKKYDIYANVNFYDFEDDKKVVKITSSGGGLLSLNDELVGGWGGEEQQEQQEQQEEQSDEEGLVGGGWGLQRP